MEELNIGNIKFNAYDLGGHLQARRIWRDYYPIVDAIVFIVDCADRDRVSETKKELDVRKMHFNTSLKLLRTFLQIKTCLRSHF